MNSNDQVSPEELDRAVSAAHIAELQRQRDELELKLARLQRQYNKRCEQLVCWANERVAAERKRHEGVVCEAARLGELRQSIFAGSAVFVNGEAREYIDRIFSALLPRVERAIWAAGWGRTCGLSLDNAPVEERAPSQRL